MSLRIIKEPRIRYLPRVAKMYGVYPYRLPFLQYLGYPIMYGSVNCDSKTNERATHSNKVHFRSSPEPGLLRNFVYKVETKENRDVEVSRNGQYINI